MRKKNKIIVAVVSVLVLAGIVAGVWPLNGYIESPGEADDLSRFVTIDGKKDTAKGQYRITSVFLTQANGFKFLQTKINPHLSYASEADVTGGESSATFSKVQDFYMQSAIANAEQVAFNKASKPITTKYRGIYVLSVSKTSHFKKTIKVGDTITAIDGHHYENSDGFIKYLANKKKGTTVTVSYTRDGKSGQAEGTTIKLPGTKTPEYPNGRAGIGIVLTDNVAVTTTPKVSVDPGQIGGPSGGLMFTLQIYDQLTGDKLANGRNISGTGTMNANGYVGEIGGIDKKIMAAKAAGSTVFFAPYIKPTKELLKYEEQHKTNYMLARDTAKKYAPNLKVIPVQTFDDAVNYLKSGKIIKTTDSTK
ncbi:MULTISPECIES: SepM family pheromone-processing serine protease [Leuconostoc]|uniref:PDZ domain-containing protein n=1 Tax=Leuconostoc pseudomesenteroides TaxID=33968 RepID=A0A5B8T148_LEUPS|nr:MULTISPECIES: SepM family pheromone-processing serine protease [Leuconostoc]MBK0041381.1 PDZ domain-containing protein [Leuconostoc sp. S51]MBK0052255.1 PDZ domain-containing protein [Leuconostoc sp. S50]MBS0957684.1 PDZ domain-containing protein [Leuconostoc pseudomesenteroides]MCC8440224.1 PDZ domain-containing protein [Leuconostoc pseudomesenteroides]MCT4379930.1 PDZ domain-containing protein [Leuconostoc pseudomesenteroides]